MINISIDNNHKQAYTLPQSVQSVQSVMSAIGNDSCLKMGGFETQKMAPECWNCGEEITFSDEWISERTGKKIPLDPDTEEPHDCIAYSSDPDYRYVECYNCGEDIFFDNEHISKNGKKIPLSRQSKKPHRCK